MASGWLPAWLQQRWEYSRVQAVLATTTAIWVLGMGSVLSFNAWAHWYPLRWVAPLSA